MPTITEKPKTQLNSQKNPKTRSAATHKRMLKNPSLQQTTPLKTHEEPFSI